MEKMMNMENKAVRTPFSRMEDGYYEFEEAVAIRAALLDDNVNTPVFVTDAEGLYEMYLGNISDPEARQHYTCNACRNFIERFGNLAMVNAEGKLESLMWDVDATPAFFKASVEAMQKAVENAKIKGVFYADAKKLGLPKTGEWTHLHMILPREMVVNTRVKTAGQQMAEKREEYRILMDALNTFSMETINKAIEVCETDAAYRADRVLGAAKAFREVKEIFDNTADANVKRNLIWMKVAKVPNGVFHIASSPVGELMKNIMSGMSLRVSAMKFSEMMGGYMVSTAAPTASAVESAERMIEKLGLADALERKYEAYANIPKDAFVWEDKGAAAIAAKAAEKAAKPAGIFAKVQTKAQANAGQTMASDMPVSVMTWAKFARTILPEAREIAALTDNRQRFMALVTAANADAENILQWDNTVSWYYNNGGIDVRMKESIEAHGGRYDNVQIRASLMWENENNRSSYGTDLDLHCMTPNGAHIYYGNKRDRSGGYLDVDANAAGTRTMDVPVENIRWTSGALNGHYKFYVKNYKQMDRRANTYKVELAIGDQIYAIEDVAGATGTFKTAFEFDYHNGTVTNLKMYGNETAASADWNVDMGTFVKVKGIVTSPNNWGEKAASRYGNHMFFLLEGCKDLAEGRGKGFINEMLKPELFEIRKTLQAYTAVTPIEGADEADACGLGFSEEAAWNLTLRVKTATGSTKVVKIDRFD